MFKRADIKMGFNCNCNCTFCVVGDLLFTGDRPAPEIIKELEEARKTCQGIVFTGGEPTIRKDFLDIVAYAKKLGFTSIQVQTNGRMFAYFPFAVKAIKAGVTEFSPAIHGHTERLHDSLVRAPGSFKEIYQGIVNLKKLKQTLITNTVVVKQNAASLPDIARMLVDLGVDQFQMAYVHGMGYVPRYFERIVPKVSEVAHYIHEAMEVGNKAGIKCMAEAVPFCHMHGYERNVTELYIPQTEIHFEGYTIQDYKTDRMNRGKTRFPQCAHCKWEHICEGPWYEYPAKYGVEEFHPIPGPKIYDGTLVLAGKEHQIGAPAPDFALLDTEGHEVTLSALRGSQVLLYFYPQDESPGCTAEACNLRDHLDFLQSLGVEVIGVSPDSVESHRSFAANHGLNFALLSDPTGEVCRKYEVIQNGNFRRTSFLIGPDGNIQHLFLDVNPSDHARQIIPIVHLTRLAELASPGAA